MDQHHDHSGHGAMGMGHPAKSMSELHHPDHGSYEGHIVPGLMFIAWSTYWLWSIIDIHLRTRGLTAGLPSHTVAAQPASSNGSRDKRGRCCITHCGVRGGCRNTHIARDEPFRSRAWYPFSWGPIPHWEPILKVALPLVGVFIELYVGFRGWRPLYAPDGHWAMDHIGNWQHALMYSGVAVSGVVDLIGFYTPLPAGTEQGFLAAAFLSETLLMGMHAKPNPLDALVHKLLTGVMISCVVVCTAEIAWPESLMLAIFRPMVVFFQGTWFWHVGAIMFTDQMAWDMEDMGAVMFIPVVFCLHIVLICMYTFTVYLFLRWVYARAGITTTNPDSSSSSSAQSYQPLGLATKQGPIAFVHTDADDSANGRDSYLIESQLELADYPSHSGGGSSRSHSGAGGSSGGGSRDAHSKGMRHL